MERYNLERGFRQLVDELTGIAMSIADIAIPDFVPSLTDEGSEVENLASMISSAFLSSKGHSVPINAAIEHAHQTVAEIKRNIKFSHKLAQISIRRFVSDVDNHTKFVRVAVGAATPKDPSDEAEVDHYKRIEGLAIAYRHLLIKFNECAKEYNDLDLGSEIKPLVSTDISAL